MVLGNIDPAEVEFLNDLYDLIADHFHFHRRYLFQTRLVINILLGVSNYFLSCPPANVCSGLFVAQSSTK